MAPNASWILQTAFDRARKICLSNDNSYSSSGIRKGAAFSIQDPIYRTLVRQAQLVSMALALLNASPMKILIVVILCVFSGCGDAPEGNKTALALEIDLPTGLRREDRLQHFNSRVMMASARFETKHGVLIEQTLPPAHWEHIAVPQLDFPKDDKDVLAVSIRIWDRNRSGFPRNYPVLVGNAHIRAAELNGGRPNTIPVRLSLAVSVADYD